MSLPSESDSGQDPSDARSDKLNAAGDDQIAEARHQTWSASARSTQDKSADAPSLSRPEVLAAVYKLSDALDGNGRPDPNKLADILEPLKAADRKAIEIEYKKQVQGQDFRLDLHQRFGKDSESIARIEALLMRGDSTTDYAGDVRRNLAKVSDKGAQAERRWPTDVLGKMTDSDDRAAAEKSLLHTIEKLDAAGITRFSEKYFNDYHRHFADDVRDNKYLSDATKQALGVLLQGSDELGKNAAGLQKLADIGLKSHRLDIFQQAMEMSPQAREAFLKAGGEAKIEKAFSDPADRALAEDYARLGQRGLASKIDGSGHFYHANKNNIDEAIESATPGELALYRKGSQLFTRGDLSQKTADEQNAIKYYRRVHESLEEAAGFADEGQVKLWENKLLGKEMHQTVEQQFDAKKDNPLDTVFHNQGKALDKINALANMSDAERKRYMAVGSFGTEYRKHINDLVSHGLQPGPEQDLARSILSKIGPHGEKPKLDGCDQVLFNQLKGAKPAETAEAIEQAFKDHPNRILHPQSPEDKRLKDTIDKQFNNLVEAGDFGGHNTADNVWGGGGSPSRQIEFSKHLYDTGHLPPELAKVIATDKRMYLDDLLHATDAQKEQLLETKSGNVRNLLPDSLFESKEQSEFVQGLLKQGVKSVSELKPEDRMRAFAVGLGEKQDSLQGLLEHLTPQQRQDAAHSYFKKYGHATMSVDVLDKVSDSERQHFRELLAHTEVTPGQQALDAQAERDRHSSIADPLIESVWDKSKTSAEEQNRNVDKLLEKYGDKNLSSEQKQQFKEALERYRQAETDYANSKKDAAEALVSATNSLGTMAVTMLAPEVALPLLMAGGAVNGIGTRMLVEGTDYKGDAQTVLRNAAQDMTAVGIGGLTPTALGMKGIFKVGEKTAGEVADHVVCQRQFKGLLKPNADEVISKELSGLTQVQAATGENEAKHVVAKLAREITTDGADNPALEKALMQQLQHKVKAAAAHRLEAEQLVRNAVTGMASNAISDAVAIGSGLKSPDDILRDLPQSAVMGASMYKIFAVSGHVSGHLIGDGNAAGSPVMIARDRDGNLYAGKGTVVRTEGGKRFTVGDEPYALGKHDQVDFSVDARARQKEVSLPSEKSPEQVRVSQSIPEAARKQSNEMSARGEVTGALEDGFTVAGKGRYVSSDGSISAPWAATVVDRANDPVLRQVEIQAKQYMAKYKNLSFEEQKAKLTEFVESKFPTHTSVPGYSNNKLVDDAYMKFATDNAGKRVYLGEYIKNQVGTCTQQSMLLKVLGDDILPEAKFKLVSGNGSDGSNSVNHIWVQSGERIYDPRQHVYGKTYESRRDTYKAASEMDKQSRVGLQTQESNIQPGKVVVYGDDAGWRVERESKDGNKVTIVHDGAMTVPVANLLKTNPQLKLKVGENLQVRRADGTVDGAWQVRAIDSKSGEAILYKPDAVRQTVAKDQLLRNMPELAGSKPPFARGTPEDAVYRAVIDNVSEMNNLRRSAGDRQSTGLSQKQADDLSQIAANLQKRIEDSKTRKEAMGAAEEVNQRLALLQQRKWKPTDAEIARLGKVVNGQEAPAVLEATKPGGAAQLGKTSSGQQTKLHDDMENAARRTDPPESALTKYGEARQASSKLPEHGDLSRPSDHGAAEPQRLTLEGLADESTKAKPDLQRKIDDALISARRGELTDLLVAQKVIPPSCDMRQSRPLSSWLKDLAARPGEFKPAVEGSRLPDRRVLMELGSALDASGIKVAGKDITYGDKYVTVNLHAGTVVDGKTVPGGGLLKIDISNAGKATDAGNQPWEARHLSPIKSLDLGDGVTANCYVQEKLTVGQPTAADIEHLQEQLEQHGQVLTDQGFGTFGKDADGHWRVLDSSVIKSSTDAAVDKAAFNAGLWIKDSPQLAKLLVQQGQIPEQADLNQERPLSSWLKEVLARPYEFSDACRLEQNRKRLWELSEQLKFLDINVKGSDITAGGESIVVYLKPGTIYKGEELKEGGVLKLTCPQAAGCFDKKSGTHDWESKRITPITKLRTDVRDTYCYVQERATPVIDSPDADLKQRMERDGKVFWDENGSPQLGRDKNGRLVVIDLSATMNHEIYNFYTRNDGVGAQLGN